MKGKKALNIIALILVTLASLWSVANLVIVVIKAPMLEKITAALGIISFVYAFTYYFTGYKKQSANFFKVFVYILGIYQLINVVIWTIMDFMDPVIGYCFCILGFITICYLAFGRDLGRERSMKAATLFCACCLVTYTVQTTKYPGMYIASETNYNNMIDAARLIMSLVLIVLMDLKYIDKAKRGRD